MTTQPQPGSPEWLNAFARRESALAATILVESSIRGIYEEQAAGIRAAADEIERLRSCLQWSRTDNVGWLSREVDEQRLRVLQLQGEHDTQAARIAELEAQLAAAREDSDRLDFMEKHGPMEHEDVYSGEHFLAYLLECDDGQTFRAAIDAARAERKDAP